MSWKLGVCYFLFSKNPPFPLSPWWQQADFILALPPPLLGKRRGDWLQNAPLDPCWDFSLWGCDPVCIDEIWRGVCPGSLGEEFLHTLERVIRRGCHFSSGWDGVEMWVLELAGPFPLEMEITIMELQPEDKSHKEGHNMSQWSIGKQKPGGSRNLGIKLYLNAYGYLTVKSHFKFKSVWILSLAT